MTDTVVVTDSNFPDRDVERGIVEANGGRLEIAQAETPAAVIEAAEGADALLVQHAPITEAVFEALDDLSVVGRGGIGVDTVDVDAATDHGVRVLNVPSYCEDEVSTHALSLLLACVRRTTRYDRAIDDGTWDWTMGRPIYRLAGSTLGLAGFGKIPRRLVEKTAGFDFDIVAYDPYLDAAELAGHGVEKVSFDELCDRSDIVSIHTPLTEETRDLFDADAFAAMQETAVLVNTARGAVVDTAALAAALDASELAAAGVDVLPTEPPDDSPLVGRDDVVLTPHAAWYSVESMADLRHTLTEDVMRTLRGGKPENLVNPSVRE